MYSSVSFCWLCFISLHKKIILISRINYLNRRQHRKRTQFTNLDLEIGFLQKSLVFCLKIGCRQQKIREKSCYYQKRKPSNFAGYFVLILVQDKQAFRYSLFL